MTTPHALLAGILLGTMLAGSALAAERDSHGLAKAIAEKLHARRQYAASIDTTDFSGTDIGCIVMPRFELRRYRYPGHAMICEVADDTIVDDVLHGRREPFGDDRLMDLLGQNASDHVEPEEVVRRVVRAVLEHQPDGLSDDATLMLFQWNGPTS